MRRGINLTSTQMLNLLTVMALLPVASADLITKQPTVGPEYGFVLVAVACVLFQCTLTVFAVAGPRYKHFTKEFIQKFLSAENGETSFLA